ncbi:Glycoside hydrolase superfamily [Penicillium coprophilum]|uniref:Glycoside hydrolase superfamily n=1 Tax=Penicillium coprophilum TaxID=36646 RepID=UPI002397F059|nr:Glycoside hydrolase superfamily [Penicillium coprophilum]KAJ5153793.1 Glycoside hydrolase superfamily [Penicillium coprophilum]
MKGAIFAAALVGSAMADGVHRRHDAFHQRREAAASSWASAVTSTIPLNPEETCGCATKVITYYGEATLVPEETTAPAPPSSSSTPTPTPESTSTLTSTVHSTSTSTLTVTVSASSSSAPAPSSSAPATSSTPAVELPTPGVSTFSTTGVYTIPATTITVHDTTTVCGATSTEVPSGTHTYGGVTTIVETATTVTCPYATVKPSGSTVTSVIETTTYVCPSAGTYTVVPPTTTSVPTSTVLVYPTPQTIVPGTYTQDESVVTVTRTDYTYICPAPTDALASTTAPAPVHTTVAATTTAAPVVTSTSKPSKTSAVSKPTGVPTELGEGQYGMTYSPYTAGGECKTKQEVLKDLTVIKGKGFNLVRVYSTDCSGLEFIGDACKELSINIIMGVFIDGSGTAGAQEQVDEISKWAEWDMVELIVVGNEAIQSGAADASTLASFIKSASESFKSAGYTGLITTTEPINVWQQHGAGALCDAVDIVGANIHPFFNADVTAEQAGEFTKGEFEELEKICGGKDVINLETGWPNAGSANGAAIPGTAQQATAIKSIAKHVGSKSIFFSFSDDTWKNPGEFNVEQHWGCSGVF